MEFPCISTTDEIDEKNFTLFYHNFKRAADNSNFSSLNNEREINQEATVVQVYRMSRRMYV